MCAIEKGILGEQGFSIRSMPFPNAGGLPPGKRVTGIVDYDNKNLAWNRYELSDGVTLRVIALPMIILSTDMTDSKGMPGYIVTWNTILRVTAPESLMGTPTPPLSPDQLKRSPTTVVSPLTNEEPWSEFELKDGHILQARTIATEVRRVSNSFDGTGMPMFLVSAQTVVNVQEPQNEAGE